MYQDHCFHAARLFHCLAKAAAHCPLSIHLHSCRAAPTTAREELRGPKPLALCSVDPRGSTEVAQAEFLPCLHGSDRADDEITRALIKVGPARRLAAVVQHAGSGEYSGAHGLGHASGRARKSIRARGQEQPKDTLCSLPLPTS